MTIKWMQQTFYFILYIFHRKILTFHVSHVPSKQMIRMKCKDLLFVNTTTTTNDNNKCRLLQILRGALRVKTMPFQNNLTNLTI